MQKWSSYSCASAYLGTGEVETIVGKIDLMDQAQREEALGEATSDVAKADLIAHNVKRVITERWDEDRAFYEKYSKLLEDTIAACRAGRMREAEYLREVLRMEKAVLTRADDELPSALRDKEVAASFYRNIRDGFEVAVMDARPVSHHTCMVRHGGTEIPITVTFAERRTLKIVVHPDLRVVVSAPKGQTLDAALARVQRRAHWILRQRRYFDQFQPRPPAKRYVSGETFYYLGRQYRLKVTEGELRSTKLVGRFLTVVTPNRAENAPVRAQVEEWYKTHALATFQGRLEACLVVAQRYGMERPQISLRRMTRRWGSSTGGKRILLNTDLVTAPVHCVDYVIMHELCHQKYRNHDSRFFQLLSRCQPDWEQRKHRLETFVLPQR